MNKHFKKADELIRTSTKDLNGLLGGNEEDISCFNPQALDTAIDLLIEARGCMSIGRLIDRHSRMES